MQDIVIIGAGITGCFLAHDLSKYNLNVTVVDRQNDIANETTMANSAVIHTGYDPVGGTLKAELNVKGARMYEQVCSDLEVDYKKCGAYIVACNPEQEETLKVLKRRADERGIIAEYLTKEQIREKEPNISDEVTVGLDIPETAIIYPWQCAIALMEEAVINGVTLALNVNVNKIEEKDDYFIVSTTQGEIETKMIINAAGCGAENVANLYEESPYHITNKKGEYFVLSRQAKGFVNHVIFPAPTAAGKGVLALPTTHGNTLLGPTSYACEPDDLSVTQGGLDFIRSHLSHIVKNIPYQEIIRSYSGLRPSGNNGDFYIKASKKNENFVHVACIDSPGLASSPAISLYVIENFIRPLMNLEEKPQYEKRKAPVVLAKLSAKEKNELIKKQPMYAKTICKCENISYQEIVDAIHSPCGARTIKAVKKRVRPGMGKCQGGFCEVEVAKILSKELNIPLKDILYDENGSKLGSEVK